MTSLHSMELALSKFSPAIFLLVACGGQNPSTPKSMFGKHNLSVIEESQRKSLPETSVGAIFLMSQDDSGRTKIFQKYCTGVQISKKHLLTNAHCMKYKAQDVFVDMHFSKKFVALDGEGPKRQVDDLFGEIYLRFQGRTRLDDVPLAERTPNVRVAMVAKDLDYAVLELTDDTSGDDSHVRFADFQPLIQSAQLGVVGFPNAMPLTRSRDCSILELKEGELRHDCDTLTGSSGGLVYDVNSGQPLALHRRGSGKNASSYYQKSGQSEDARAMAERQCREDFGLGPQDGNFSECIQVRQTNFIFNQAIPLADIAKSLGSSHPDLYKAVSEAQHPLEPLTEKDPALSSHSQAL